MSDPHITDLSEPPVVGCLRVELQLAQGLIPALERSVMTLQTRLAWERNKVTRLCEVIRVLEADADFATSAASAPAPPSDAK